MSTKAQRREKKRRTRDRENSRKFVTRTLQRHPKYRKRFAADVKAKRWCKIHLPLLLAVTLSARYAQVVENVSQGYLLLNALKDMPSDSVDGGATIYEPLQYEANYDWKQFAATVEVPGGQRE